MRHLTNPSNPKGNLFATVNTSVQGKKNDIFIFNIKSTIKLNKKRKRNLSHKINLQQEGVQNSKLNFKKEED